VTFNASQRKLCKKLVIISKLVQSCENYQKSCWKILNFRILQREERVVHGMHVTREQRSLAAKRRG